MWVRPPPALLQAFFSSLCPVLVPQPLTNPLASLKNILCSRCRGHAVFPLDRINLSYPGWMLHAALNHSKHLPSGASCSSRCMLRPGTIIDLYYGDRENQEAALFLVPRERTKQNEREVNSPDIHALFHCWICFCVPGSKITTSKTVLMIGPGKNMENRPS